MAIIQEDEKAVDVWFTAARRYEVKALRARLYYSGYLRKLFKNSQVLGDKAYKGINGIEICKDREQKAER